AVSGIVVDVVNEVFASRPRSVERKEDGSSVTDLDFKLQGAIAETLRSKWPEYPLLGEEMTDNEQQSVLADADAGFWCLDPLDGTTNFIAGFPFYGVSLAFVQAGATQVGVVFDPERNECFAAQAGRGATLNGEPIHVRKHNNWTSTVACVDLKRLPRGLAAQLAISPPYKSQRNIGASVLEWCWLAAGRFHVYVHGSQKLWDYAAGQLILSESGGIAETLGRESVLSIESLETASDTRSVVAAGDRHLFEAWRSWLEAHL
ncbi:MAG: inositol monophosphatase family protein, partial [Gammaproteobacteria bacterium]|nr:inositol monophosphatase family protein [Gammaproteobacteria bacterium]